MAHCLVTCDLFRADLDSLPRKIQTRTVAKFPFLERNPRHPSLNSHRVHASPSGRDIWESYVDKTRYRILWEFLPGQDLALWRTLTEISFSGQH